MKPKHNIFSGDFVIILGILLGFLLTGGTFAHMSKYDSNPVADNSETQIITQPVSNPQNSLQLNTFDVERCSNQEAIEFLVDVSGSMQFGGKMGNLQKALHLFESKYSPTGLVALQSFSDKVEDRVPFDLFKNVKDNFHYEVDALKPETATRSKDAFTAAQKNILAAKYMYPNYKFSLVFISDGIPETADANKICKGGKGPDNPYCAPHPLDANACRCYDTAQDPTTIANELKNNGIRIFTIAYPELEEQKFDTILEKMMMDVASTPGDYYRAPADNKIDGIITQISNRICSQI